MFSWKLLGSIGLAVLDTNKQTGIKAKYIYRNTRIFVNRRNFCEKEISIFKFKLVIFVVVWKWFNNAIILKDGISKYLSFINAQ